LPTKQLASTTYAPTTYAIRLPTYSRKFKMQHTKAIILAAAALIENPEAWTQNVPARNKKGASVDANSQQACSWCALGAVDKVSYDYNSWLEATRKVRDVLRGEKPYISIAKFNDNHTHAEVLALLRKAAG
jgi:hypothetical protein